MASAPLGQQLRALLDQHQLDYQWLEHPPTSTCAQSAAARGMSQAIGGKTLMVKARQQFHLFVLPADQQADSTAIRRILASGKLRFATAAELMQVAGVEKGALPPFGRPLLPLDLYLDEGIRANTQIAFNCGTLTASVVMATEDYLSLVSPIWTRFSLC